MIESDLYKVISSILKDMKSCKEIYILTTLFTIFLRWNSKIKNAIVMSTFQQFLNLCSQNIIIVTMHTI